MNFNYFSGFGVRVKKVTKGRLDSILGVGLSDEHAWECQFKRPPKAFSHLRTLFFLAPTLTHVSFSAPCDKSVRRWKFKAKCTAAPVRAEPSHWATYLQHFCSGWAPPSRGEIVKDPSDTVKINRVGPKACILTPTILRVLKHLSKVMMHHRTINV